MQREAEMASWAAKRPANDSITGLLIGSLKAQFYLLFLTWPLTSRSLPIFVISLKVYKKMGFWRAGLIFGMSCRVGYRYWARGSEPPSHGRFGLQKKSARAISSVKHAVRLESTLKCRIYGETAKRKAVQFAECKHGDCKRAVCCAVG